MKMDIVIQFEQARKAAKTATYALIDLNRVQFLTAIDTIIDTWSASQGMDTGDTLAMMEQLYDVMSAVHEAKGAMVMQEV